MHWIKGCATWVVATADVANGMNKIRTPLASLVTKPQTREPFRYFTYQVNDSIVAVAKLGGQRQPHLAEHGRSPEDVEAPAHLLQVSRHWDGKILRLHPDGARRRVKVGPAPEADLHPAE